MTRDDIETRYSQVCARSGTVVLGLSIVLLACLHPLKITDSLAAGQRYIMLRHALALAVGQVQNDDCWRALESAGKQVFDGAPALEQRLEVLREVTCSASSDGTVEVTSSLKGEQSRSPDAKNSAPTVAIPPGKLEDHTPPAAPTGFGVRTVWKSPLPHLNEVIELFAALHRDNLLSRAQEASLSLNRAIAGWDVVRFRLEAARAGLPNTGAFGDAKGGDPLSDPKAVAKRFSFSDIVQLANDEVPDVSLYGEIETGYPTVSVSSISLPVPIRQAVLALELAILLATSYLWAHFRVAISTGRENVGGMLFRVFNNDRPSRVVFLLMLLFPAISVLLLGWATFGVFGWNLLFGGMTCVFLGDLIRITVLRQVGDQSKPPPENTTLGNGGL